MKKKLLTALLTMTMVMGLGAAVMADETTPAPATVSINKNYEALHQKADATSGAELYVSPAETFNFTIDKVGVTDAASGVTKDTMPEPTLSTIQYGAGDAGSATNKTKPLTVTLPDYTSVGVYTYTIKETDGKTAGVSYLGKDITLVVTVQQIGDQLVPTAVFHMADDNGNDTKPDHFDNTYSAGSLAVSKEVTGNLGDRSKEFTVTVTFETPDADTVVRDDITYLDGTTAGTIAPTAWTKDTTKNKNVASVDITLKHGETVTFDNVPYGVTYTVKEADYTADGYKAAVYSGSDGTDGQGGVDSAAENVKITNEKTTPIDTGIFLNNMPYIIIAVIVVCGLAFILLGRRRREER